MPETTSAATAVFIIAIIIVVIPVFAIDIVFPLFLSQCNLLILLLHLFLCNLSSSLLAYSLCPSLAVICLGQWKCMYGICQNCLLNFQQVFH